MLTSARTFVEAAGVTCNASIVVRLDAETLLEHADTTHCDGIVMGTRGLGSRCRSLDGIGRQQGCAQRRCAGDANQITAPGPSSRVTTGAGVPGSLATATM